MDDVGPDSQRQDEAANVLRLRLDADWAKDREFVDHQIRDPWSSEDQ
jgi:hypothetical protein